MFFFFKGDWKCSSGCFLNSFFVEKYVNNIFLFFKNYFTIQKIQTALNFSKKKIKIFQKTGSITVPTGCNTNLSRKAFNLVNVVFFKYDNINIYYFVKSFSNNIILSIIAIIHNNCNNG